MTKAIFLDRDGTINVDHGYVYKVEELELLPGVIDALKLFKEAGFIFIVITNQSGIGRGYYTLEDANKFNKALSKLLANSNIEITEFYTCPHAPTTICSCRKPSPELINKAIESYNINPSNSYMFGDKKSDIECGENAGVKSFLITENESLLYWAKKIV